MFLQFHTLISFYTVSDDLWLVWLCIYFSWLGENTVFDFIVWNTLCFLLLHLDRLLEKIVWLRKDIKDFFDIVCLQSTQRTESFRIIAARVDQAALPSRTVSLCILEPIWLPPVQYPPESHTPRKEVYISCFSFVSSIPVESPCYVLFYAVRP